MAVNVCVQVKVSKPTPEQMVVLDVQFGEKQKAKEKKEDDTITESTILHGLSTNYLSITEFSPFYYATNSQLGGGPFLQLAKHSSSVFLLYFAAWSYTINLASASLLHTAYSSYVLGFTAYV